MPRGVDSGGHPGRQVGRDRWSGVTVGQALNPRWLVRDIPNFEDAPPHPVAEEAPESEPDYEAIMERRHERRRPDWA